MAADRVLEGSEAEIEHSGGDRASCNMGTDRIHLPFREQFASAPGYSSTALDPTGPASRAPTRVLAAPLPLPRC